MIERYAAFLEDLEPVAYRLGFTAAENDDYSAEFRRPTDGWRIVLAGERYDNGLFLEAVRVWADPPRRYALWLLMELFAEKIAPERRLPNWDNQLWFLEAFAGDIFGNEAVYKRAYAERNEVDWEARRAEGEK